MMNHVGCFKVISNLKMNKKMLKENLLFYSIKASSQSIISAIM